MRPRWLAANTVVALSLLLVSACGREEEPTTPHVAPPDARTEPRVRLFEAVEFTSPDGGPVLVEAGTYLVERVGDGSLGLRDEGGDETVLLAASAGRTENRAGLEGARLLAPGDSSARYLAMLRKDGQGLVAVGSRPGERSRGPLMAIPTILGAMGAGSAGFLLPIFELDVVRPGADEIWAWGFRNRIRWTWRGLRGATASSVSITLYREGGACAATIAASAPNSGVFGWTVPSGLTGRFRISVAMRNFPYAEDVSAPFTIEGGYAPTPAQVEARSNATRIATGMGTAMVARLDGTVWRWGTGWAKLGPIEQPSRKPGLEHIRALETEDFFGFAIDERGAIWSWCAKGWEEGDPSDPPGEELAEYGVLGDGTTQWRYDVRCIGGSATKVRQGGLHVLALGTDGRVRTWGSNYRGKLGIGKTWSERKFSASPVDVAGLSHMVDVAAGWDHCLAVRSTDGTVWVWGDNAWSQLGVPGMEDGSTVPVQIPNLATVVAVDAGFYHSLALKHDGSVWAWGTNWDGELGLDDPSITQSPIPRRVPGIQDVVAIAARERMSFAITADGRVWRWGRRWGQDEPLEAPTPLPFAFPGIKVVAPQDGRTLALTSDGSVWEWGNCTGWPPRVVFRMDSTTMSPVVE